MTTLLEVAGLGISFGGLRAVDALDFVVNEREIVGLIGPNGAGKSTLFDLINGVRRPDDGQVMLAGIDVTGWPPWRVVRLGLARTHQIVRPLNSITVFENCVVGACFGGTGAGMAEARRIAASVLEEVGLADRSGTLAQNLTIAGKKRLELARALSARPKLLLLDEVLAGLNPVEVESMVAVLRAVRARGVAILMIEHLMQAIMTLSDRVVVLNFGRKLAEGVPAAVAQDPKVIEAYLGRPGAARRIAGGAA